MQSYIENNEVFSGNFVGFGMIKMETSVAILYEEMETEKSLLCRT